MSLITIGVPSVILLCYAFGIFILIQGIKEIRLGLGARSWPTVDACLQRCTLDAFPTGGNGIVYRVSVKYTYTLASLSYTGENLAIGYGGSNNREEQERVRQQIMGMSRFVIRYHPEKPEESTIFPAENSLIFGGFVGGVIWLGLTSCFTIVALAISGLWRSMFAWFA
jgi:hypothetical protein